VLCECIKKYSSEISWPWHHVDLGCQLQTPATLLPGERHLPSVSVEQEAWCSAKVVRSKWRKISSPSGIEPRLPGSRARSRFTILAEKSFLHVKTIYIVFFQVKTLQILVRFNIFNNCRPITSTLYLEDENSNLYRNVYTYFPDYTVL
jgi:hypothetical protein